MKKFWYILLVIAVVAGAAYAGWRLRKHQDTVAATTAANADTASDATATTDQPATGNTVDTTPAQPTTPTAVPPAAPATTPAPKPASLTEMATVVYPTPTTAEKPIVAAVQQFETSYNHADVSAMSASFSLSVSVTSAINAAVAAGQARPIKATIERIEIRSDSSVLVTITETRQSVDSTTTVTVHRLLELNPAKGGSFEIASYTTTDSTDPVSGFGAK